MEQYRYRVVQNSPSKTWRIEELWEGGVIRSPYKTCEEAIEREKAIARYFEFDEVLELVG